MLSEAARPVCTFYCVSCAFCVRARAEHRAFDFSPDVGAFKRQGAERALLFPGKQSVRSATGWRDVCFVASF